MTTINRRNFLAAAGAVAGSAVLSACGGASEETTAEESDQTTDEEVSGGVMDAEKEEEGYDLVTPGTLTAAIVRTNYPFTQWDEDADVYKGFDIDLSKTIASKLGMQIEYIEFDYTDYETRDNGRQDPSQTCDIICSGIMAEALPECPAFSDPYLTTDLRLIVSPYDTPDDTEVTADNYSTLLNMDSSIIGVEKLTTAEQIALEMFPNARLKDPADAFAVSNFVQAGACDAGIITGVACKYLTDDGYGDGDTYREVATVSSGDSYVIGFAREDTNLMADINDAIADLKADGTIDELASTWGIA